MAQEPARHSPAPAGKPRLAVATLLLIALNLIVFAQSFTFGSVYLDDRLYLTENQHVLNGLTVEGLRYAFSTQPAPMSNPLTLVSHMLDVQLFGDHLGWHHATNVMFHTLNAALLFLVLFRATGAYGCSLVVAAIFAVHPLHVENVAWISGRKDLLSTTFFLLAIWAYLGYAKSPGVLRMAAVAGWFTLSVLAKPMAVTFPFVLLLLDVWPLRRIALDRDGLRGGLRLVWEKLPLFGITVLASYGTWYLQHLGGATLDLEDRAFSVRVLNAIAAYGIYVRESILPFGLSVFYPTPTPIPVAQIVFGALVLAAGTFVSVRYRKTMPWIFVGWFLFVGMLVPVIGLVQVGSQAHADRYMYVPLVGLSVMAVWTVAAWLNRAESDRRRYAAIAAAAVVAVFAVLGVRQTHLWRDSVPLFEHAMAATGDNAFIELNLAGYYVDTGRGDLATPLLKHVIELEPEKTDAYYNLALIARGKGDLDGAIALLQTAAKIDEKSVETRVLLADLYIQNGEAEDAMKVSHELQQLAPNSADGYTYNGMALGMLNRGDEAVDRLRRGAALAPNDAWTHARFAEQLARTKQFEEAAREYEKALKLGDANVVDWYNAALVFETINRPGTAARLYEQVLAREPGFKKASERLERLKRQ